jgi:hypothetical protein
MRSPVKYYALLSVLAAYLCGCSQSDDLQKVPQYSLTVQAVKESGDIETRALFLGGNNGNRFYSLWDSGDKAEVYKDGSYVGTLTPTTIGGQYTELTGTLVGSFAENDEIDVYVPAATMDFTGQKGTVGDLSANHAFVMKTIKVTAVENGNVTTEKLAFESRNCYIHFIFLDEDGMRLHPEQLTIHAAGGMLVQTKTKEGVATYGDLIVNLEKVNGEYPGDVYVSLHNDLGAKDLYTFTVKAGGYTYCSNNASTSFINSNLKDGKVYNATKTLTMQGSASRIGSQLNTTIIPHTDGGGDNNGSVAF